MNEHRRQLRIAWSTAVTALVALIGALAADDGAAVLPGHGVAVVGALYLVVAGLSAAACVLSARQALAGAGWPYSPVRPSTILIGLVTVGLLAIGLAARSGIVFGLLGLAIIFVPLERLFALHRQRVFRAGWATDVVHLVVNNVLSLGVALVGIVTVGTVLRLLVPSTARSWVGGLPWGAQLAIALVITEVCQYWAHRAAHQVPLLWRFHKVHHSIREMDWLAAGHLHPLDQAFERTVVVAPLFALGFSRATFGAYLVLTTFQAIFIHANVRLRFGPLRWLIATPEFHHWHHADDPSAYDRNFAGQLPVLDWVFGTLHLPAGQRPAGYGIAERQPAGYVRQLVWPFRATPSRSIAF